MATLPTPTFAQQQPAPALSSAQLRDLVLQATDKIERLEKESTAAAEYIDALKKSSDADAKLITSLEQRDTSRREEITSLRSSLTILQAALSTSEKATASATAEAVRQKNRASFWKKLAGIGTIAGAVAGATAVVLITR
jgi:small-conductance mechanosensitive channel